MICVWSSLRVVLCVMLCIAGAMLKQDEIMEIPDIAHISWGQTTILTLFKYIHSQFWKCKYNVLHNVLFTNNKYIFLIEM